MIVGGGPQDLNRLIAGKRPGGDLLGFVPSLDLLGLIADAVAGEGELAGVGAIGALINDAANGLGIGWVLDAVENDLGDRELAASGFGAGLEIDGARQAIRFGQTEFALGDELLFSSRPILKVSSRSPEAGALDQQATHARRILDQGFIHEEVGLAGGDDFLRGEGELGFELLHIGRSQQRSLAQDGGRRRRKEIGESSRLRALCGLKHSGPCNGRRTQR